MKGECYGAHQIFVAEVVAVESEGKLVVVNVCRSCGEVTFHEHVVAKAFAPIIFTKEKEKEQKHELQLQR